MNSKNNSNKTSVDNVWQYAQLRIKVYANLLAACTDDELREKKNESNVTVAGRKNAAIICKPCVTNVSVGEFN